MGVEMRNQAAIDAFRRATESNDMGELTKMLMEYGADDFVEEWPQSGERLRRESAIKVGEQYEGTTGTSPKMKLRRILSEGDMAVIEGTIDYGDGTPVSYIGIAEFRDGKVARMTEYFANPFPAPEWRKPFVEPMD